MTKAKSMLLCCRTSLFPLQFHTKHLVHDLHNHLRQKIHQDICSCSRLSAFFAHINCHCARIYLFMLVITITLLTITANQISPYCGTVGLKYGEETSPSSHHLFKIETIRVIIKTTCQCCEQDCLPINRQIIRYI